MAPPALSSASRSADRSPRGALLIGAAKFFFLAAGLAQNVVTPLAIGQAPFGAFRRALAFVNVLNNVVVVASLQALARAVANGVAPRRLLVFHAALGALLGGAFFAATPLVVAYQHAPQLASVLHFLALVPFAYGVYAPLVGILNGARAFGRQAALDASFSVLRTTSIAAVGYLFVRRGLDGATGGAAGFAIASFVIVVVAFFAVDRGAHRDGAPADLRDHARFFAGLLAAQLFQSLTLQIDIVLLGREATLRAFAAGMTADDAHHAADRLAGLYAQVQGFGLVPYQILVAASLVLFPAIAAARARADHDAIRGEVARGGRATLLVAGTLIVAIAGAPASVLRFVYGGVHGDGIDPTFGASTLRHLAFGHGATSIAMVGVTLIAASGRARSAAILSAVVAVFATTGAAIGARLAPDPARLPHALSLGLAIGIACGALVVARAVHATIGSYVRAATLLKVGVAVALAMVAGAFVPTPSRLLCALTIPIPLVVYALATTIMREDLRTLLPRPRA